MGVAHLPRTSYARNMPTNAVRLSADDRTRLSLSRLGAHPRDEFLASTNPDGSITLVPVALIPKRELLVWENPELRASILTGMAEIAAGLATANADLDADLDESDD